MNNNTLGMGNTGFGNNIGFGNGTDAFRDSLRARGYKTAGERKAEEEAKAAAEPKAEQTEQNNTDQIASQLGNRMLRDLGAFMLNPVKGSFDFNKQLFKEALGAPFRLMNQGKNEEAPAEETKEEVKEEVKEEPKAEETTDDGETIEYTYKPGDTFGQVIKDLGLESGNGLWGDNGDVNYYTQQLIDQGIWEDGIAHNIPIGTTIKLKARPMTQQMIEYRKQYGYN